MKYIEAIVLGIVVWMAAPALWAAAPSGQYTVTNGTVKDNKTGLIWQQAVTIQDDWTGAKNACERLSLGGFSSWRLPTKLELESLVDFRVGYPDPKIDLTAFPSTPANRFWTSTRFADDTGYVWTVDFGMGVSGSYVATPYWNWARCVR